MSQNKTEKMGFQTEVSQLLHLVTHSLYSNKEIFLRELISNSSDAIDKLRFVALSDNSIYNGDAQLEIKISFDEKANTLTISDNGIGMSKEELVDHLGTIAKSGTKSFFNQLSGDENKDSELIGQFGVGFYSAFIVADQVKVESLKAGETQASTWFSDGKSDFELSDSDKTTRGTEITLFLKDDAKEFTNRYTVNQVITKYSDHISTPVLVWSEPVAEEKNEKGEVIVEAKAGQFEQVNKAKALWTRPKSEITDEEYQEFYKHISHDFQDAIAWSHNKVEGKLEYTSLLYLPQKAPWDMFQRDSKHGLKLFVQRVFIMDQAEQFLPNYLRFVKGVIDSNDLPLNVSREILQDSAVTQSLRKACTKRVLSMLLKATEDKESYQTFWHEFSNAIKEGVGEDFANREELAKLLRFASTNDKAMNPDISLDDYLSRMPEGQDKIYYLVADSKASAKSSPHLEIFEKNNIEVLLMWDRIDEWMMSYLSEFSGKTFEPINKTDINDPIFKNSEETEKTEAQEKDFSETLQSIKETLGDRVIDVRASKRLTKTPSCVVLESNAMSSQMLKMMQAAGQTVPEQKYIFELNLTHPMVKNLKSVDAEQLKIWTQVLFDQAVLSEQGSLDDTSEFIANINQLLSN